MYSPSLAIIDANSHERKVVEIDPAVARQTTARSKTVRTTSMGARPRPQIVAQASTVTNNPKQHESPGWYPGLSRKGIADESSEYFHL